MDIIKPRVIRDTREKHGWIFNETDSIAGTVVDTMSTGDYTLEGFEDELCIERKSNLTEFANNLLTARFERELQRLEKFKYKYIIIEANMDDFIRYPEGIDLPEKILKRLRTKGIFLLKKLLELQMEYGFVPLFAGTEGKTVAISIFKRIMEQYRNDKTQKEQDIYKSANKRNTGVSTPKFGRRYRIKDT